MKRRKLSAFIMMIIFLLLLSACSSSFLQGRFALTEVKDDPNGITFEEMEMMYKSQGLNPQHYLYMEFTDKGRFALVLFGDEAATGRYTQENNRLTLTSEGGITIAEISGQTITWTNSEGTKFIFRKI